MRFLAFFILIALTYPVRAEVLDVRSRGETVRLLVEEGDNPFATVVLFAGGHGVLKISKSGGIKKLGGNFLVRARDRFQSNGAVTAVIDAPTDERNKLHGFRSTEDHAKDVGAVIKSLREKYKLPVWLIGTSRGTNSVANAAVRLKGADKPDGIVLTATMTAYHGPWGGDYVTNMDIEDVKLPVLIVHHKKDDCRVTPADKVDDLRDELENAKPVKVLWYEGGSGIRGSNCGARHYHGFNGIEEQVVKDIMNWVKSPSP